MAFSLANENNTGESSANPMTGTISTGGIGSNTQLVVVYVATNRAGNTADAAPTLGGSSMTIAGSYEATSEGGITMWYAIGNFGINNSLAISVTNSYGRTLSLMSSSWNLPSGKTATFGSAAQASSSGSTNPTVTVSFPAAPSMVVSGLFTGAASVNGLSAGRTLLGKYDTGSEGQAHQYYLNQKQASNVNMNWVFSTSDDWATVGGSFQEITGTPSGDVASHDTVIFANIGSLDGTAIANISSIDGVLTGN